MNYAFKQIRQIANTSVFVLLSLFFPFSVCAQNPELELSSPNGQIEVTIKLADKIYYSVNLDSQKLLENSSLQMDLQNQTLGKNPRLSGTKASTINEEIHRVVPLRNALVHNHCNVLLLKFRGNYSVEFRAYDDGVAYRFLVTQGKKDLEIFNEEVQLQFPQTFEAVVTPTPSFKTPYETSYVKTNTADFATLEKSTLPLLVEAPNGVKVLISEADLFDYPCLFLKGGKGDKMQGVFPKCPIEFGPDGDRSVKIVKEADYIAKTRGNRSFPWRVFMISREDKQIFGNELVFKLSRPSELEPSDWINPGQVVWEYWHDARLYGVDFKSGYNLESYKYYIDFASKNGIPYIIMDEGWAKSTLDPYTPNPNIDLFKLISYGQSRDVKIVLWLTWLTVENHMELFKTFSEWGIAGVKIDFMNRSDQWMVNYYERVAREAAKHHLFIDYHGAFKPAGMERALPNILSYEGVVGMEQNIFGGRATTDNNAYLPFIRNVVGPMDYTPGAMNTVHPEDYKSTRTNPVSIGTRAYQLALFVVFESGVQMLADNPYYYFREKECTDFIRSVPVVWDTTRVVAAKVGEYFVVAKCDKGKWYIGAITNSRPRIINLDLSFLQNKKNYTMTAFQDGMNANVQAMDYKKVVKPVRKGDVLTINLARDGGWAAILELE